MSKNQIVSPLIQSVTTLDNHFSELIRLGEKINELHMKSDADFELGEKLMRHFSEHGEGVASEVVVMSEALNALRTTAEAAAQLVAARAEQLKVRKDEEQRKMQEFHLLGEKVRELTATLSDIRPKENQVQTPEEKARLAEHLADIEIRIQPLIEEATSLRKEAHFSKMKILEQSADSLGQSLSAVSKRLSSAQLS